MQPGNQAGIGAGNESPTTVAPIDLRATSAEELKARSHAQQGGLPILVYRGPDAAQRIVVLDTEEEGRWTIGRRADNRVPLPWDPNTSRVHAEIEALGGEWIIVDDGLSRNGSFVNGRRLTGRHRLADGDVITVGMTPLLYRAPIDHVNSTAAAGARADTPRLTDIQRRVLIALCRPCRDPNHLRAPATNNDIADEVSLSVAAVKSHLRVLFTKFAVGDLAQNQKRVTLVAAALRTGAIEPHDLD